MTWQAWTAVGLGFAATVVVGWFAFRQARGNAVAVIRGQLEPPEGQGQSIVVTNGGPSAAFAARVEAGRRTLHKVGRLGPGESCTIPLDLVAEGRIEVTWMDGSQAWRRSRVVADPPQGIPTICYM